jgi:hypothetical protein
MKSLAIAQAVNGSNRIYLDVRIERCFVLHSLEKRRSFDFFEKCQ